MQSEPLSHSSPPSVFPSPQIPNDEENMEDEDDRDSEENSELLKEESAEPEDETRDELFTDDAALDCVVP